jgi:HlyD family secretion protein
MKRRTAVVALVVVLATVAVFVVGRARRGGNNESARFRTAEVARGDLLISVSASGIVEAESLVDVRSRATGQVVSVLVEESDQVVKGQLLVVIDDPDARAALENARTSYTAALARLSQTQANVEIQRAGTATQVQQAEANVAAARARLAQLRTPRSEEVAQAEEVVRQAQANAELARQNLARNEQLFRDGFISRSQLDQARSEEQVAQSQVRAAQLRLQQVRTGASQQEVDVARAQLQQAEAQLADARNGVLQQRLREEEVRASRAQLQSAAAAVRQAQERVNEGRITAPVAGMVAKRSVSVGQSVIGSSTGGTPVLTLAKISPILARVMVDEADIARITSSARVEVTADALPGKTFRARILRIAPQSVVEQNVTQYPVVVEIDDPQRLLKLGMTVDAEFVLARRTNVLLVPQEAVRGGESKAVMIVDGEKLTPRIVQVGISDGRFVEILNGVREGEIVYLGTAGRTGPAEQQRPGNPFQPRFQQRR